MSPNAAPAAPAAVPARSALRRSLAALALGTALTMSGCSAQGDDDATAVRAVETDQTTTTATTAPESSTTTVDDGQSADPPDTDPAGGKPIAAGLTAEDLSALFPDPSEIPGDFAAAESAPPDPDDVAMYRAIAEGCPVAGELFNEEDDPDSLTREYEDPSSRTFVVLFSSEAPALADPTRMDRAREEVDACPEVVFDFESGERATIRFFAEENHSRGQGGSNVTIPITLEHPDLDRPLEHMIMLEVWTIEGLVVGLLAGGGAEAVSSTEVRSVPPDGEFLRRYSAELEGALWDLISAG